MAAIALLRPLAGSTMRAVSLVSGVSVVGRGSHGLVDPRLSRQHARLTSTGDPADTGFLVECLGTNPLQLLRKGESAVRTLRSEQSPAMMLPGDTLFLLP
eukprot:764092-Prymnesium_polylepis.1